MCRIDDGYCAQVSRTSWHKARKEYRCGECSRQIKIGERYRYYFVVYDGDPATFRGCSHCEAPKNWLVENCGGYAFTEVCADIHEHAREYPSLAYGLLRLVVGMNRGWRRFDGNGLMAVQPVPRGIESVVAESA